VAVSNLATTSSRLGTEVVVVPRPGDVGEDVVVEAAGEELAVEVDPAVGAPTELQEAETMVSATTKAAIPAGNRFLRGTAVISRTVALDLDEEVPTVSGVGDLDIHTVGPAPVVLLDFRPARALQVPKHDSLNVHFFHVGCPLMLDSAKCRARSVRALTCRFLVPVAEA